MNDGHLGKWQLALGWGCWQWSSQLHPHWVPALCSDSIHAGLMSTIPFRGRKCMFVSSRVPRARLHHLHFHEQRRTNQRGQEVEMVSLALSRSHDRLSGSKRLQNKTQRLLRKMEIRKIEVEETQSIHLMCFANSHKHSSWTGSSTEGPESFLLIGN